MTNFKYYIIRTYYRIFNPRRLESLYLGPPMLKRTNEIIYSRGCFQVYKLDIVDELKSKNNETV